MFIIIKCFLNWLILFMLINILFIKWNDFILFYFHFIFLFLKRLKLKEKYPNDVVWFSFQRHCWRLPLNNERRRRKLANRTIVRYQFLGEQTCGDAKMESGSEKSSLSGSLHILSLK